MVSTQSQTPQTQTYRTTPQPKPTGPPPQTQTYRTPPHPKPMFGVWVATNLEYSLSKKFQGGRVLAFFVCLSKICPVGRRGWYNFLKKNSPTSDIF